MHKRAESHYHSNNLSELVSCSTSVFASRSEIAISHFLEKYSSWKPIPGKTIQVVVCPPDRSIDFVVGKYALEYHPFVIQRAFGSRDAEHTYHQLMKRLPNQHKEMLESIVETELNCQYYKRRRQLLDNNPEYSKLQLIVCKNPREFFEFLRTVATVELPPMKKLCHDFQRIRHNESN